MILVLCGCSGSQSVLNPAGPQAERIATLWWAMLLVAAAVLALVVALLLVASLRSRGERPVRPLDARKSHMLVLCGGVLLPLAVIVPFIASSFSLGAAIGTPPPGAMTIEVIGRMWWWEVHYQDRNGRRIATTANEIHIPVGRPVRFLLESGDVIHSFWLPNLNGKTDMVPGRTNVSWLQADRSGVYRGQCAEFCGVQHGLMAFLVVAQPPEQFDAWLTRQRQPAREPGTEELQRGRTVFLESTCRDCHAIRGTPATATAGPDLTHIGSRRMLAAATVANNTGHLGGWIADPQHIKPGNAMPPTALPPADLKALIRYLESLQ